MAATSTARRAEFDPATQRRRAMIAKIQIARKDLAMEEDDYRQIVFNQTGRTSLKEANPGELDAVLKVMVSKGFRPLPKAGSGRAAQHPVAGKARALWISLYQLGEVHNSGEAAFEAFACKQLGCDKLVWARQSDGFKLIEALKSWAERSGWRQTDPVSGARLTVLQLQQGLCAAILARLVAAGVARADWTLNLALERLCGFVCDEAWTTETYSRAAAALGAKLRELGGAR